MGWPLLTRTVWAVTSLRYTTDQIDSLAWEFPTVSEEYRMYKHIEVSDAFHDAIAMARSLKGDGLVGYGVVLLENPDGIVDMEAFANLITTPGDQYYAQKGITGIAPASPSAPTAMSGMKLGTGATAAAKSGAGGALVTYLAASNLAFDASFPAAAAVGGDTGWNANYKTTWAAGVATNGAITEAVIVNDSATNATSTAANTIARTVFTAKNKTVDDSLAITWSHKFLGA